MRKILSLIVLTVFLACNSDTKTDTKGTKDDNSTTKTEVKNEEVPKPESTSEVTTTTKSALISNFLTDTSSLEDIEGKKNPIVMFQELADNEASEVIRFTKDNIEDILSKAKQYKNCVITTEDHTIVKIIDSNDCKQSGSWAACMPYAIGYIKKGALVSQEDYINNIIGLPNSQERIAYFFN